MTFSCQTGQGGPAPGTRAPGPPRTRPGTVEESLLRKALLQPVMRLRVQPSYTQPHSQPPPPASPAQWALLAAVLMSLKQKLCLRTHEVRAKLHWGRQTFRVLRGTGAVAVASFLLCSWLLNSSMQYHLLKSPSPQISTQLKDNADLSNTSASCHQHRLSFLFCLFILPSERNHFRLHLFMMNVSAFLRQDHVAQAMLPG